MQQVRSRHVLSVLLVDTIGGMWEDDNITVFRQHNTGEKRCPDQGINSITKDNGHDPAVQIQ